MPPVPVIGLNHISHQAIVMLRHGQMIFVAERLGIECFVLIAEFFLIASPKLAEDAEVTRKQIVFGLEF